MKVQSLNILTFLLLFTFSLGVKAQSFPLAQGAYPEQNMSSVMASGHWVKIAVDATGVYRLTDEELRNAGFKDPQKVGVYGYGGGELPGDIRRIQDRDLPAVPILRQGSAIYFYGIGSTTWYYDKTRFRHYTNIYSSYGYYLLSDAQAPKLIQTQTKPTGQATPIDSYTEVLLHEVDNVSLRQSGRDLYGEPFSHKTTQSWTERIPASAVGGKATATIRFISRNLKPGTLRMSVEKQPIIEKTLRIEGIEPYAEYIAGYATLADNTTSFNISAASFPVEVSYTPTGQSSYLDYYELNVAARFAYEKGRQMPIRLGHTEQPVSIQISGAPQSLLVFSASSSISAELVSSTNGQITLPQAAIGSDHYIALAPEDAYKPTILAAVPNQNLRAAETPDLLILTPTALRSEAERLAEYHRSADALKVLVATQEEVFNEYSGGTPDATAIRLWAKTYYDRWRKTSGTERDSQIQLLLFGDGSYDNRKISADWQTPDLQRTEFLLTYQSVNSLNVYSYTSDGYFCLLDNDDNLKSIGSRRQVIGVGRLPIRTVEQARTAVDKTIRFAEDKNPGSWKTRAAFLADNGDGLSHARQSLEVSSNLLKVRPDFILDQILLERFQRVTINGKTTVPEAERRLNEALNSGIYLLNYNGHGGPAGLGDEQIITMASVKKLRNEHLPLWIIATCDFSNFDHFNTSAGEEVLLNNRGGAATMITTTRVVFDVYNRDLNRELMKQLYEDIKPDGHSKPLGSALSSARNTFPADTVNKMCFILLGDPAVRLKFPTRQIKIETINGQEAGGTKTIPLKALERASVKGSICDNNGDIDSSFSGKLFATVFDSKQFFTLKLPNSEMSLTYQDYPSVIYAGIIEVKDGKYDLNFVVPKDLIYGDTNGKINLYAYDTERRIEASGVDLSMYIAPGTATGEEDTTPPVIESLYLGDLSWKDGNSVNSTPLLVADIFEESGINRSGLGPGHSIELVIDGREDLSYNLNNYYTPSPLDASRGQISYLLPAQSEGDHTARLSIWDVFNNVTVHHFSFRVVEGLKPNISAVIAYPNPVHGDMAHFQITTNQPGTELQCHIEIFDFTGRQVYRSATESITTFDGSPAVIDLPLGRVLPQGLYLYRAVVGHEGGAAATEPGKLVIARQ